MGCKFSCFREKKIHHVEVEGKRKSKREVGGGRKRSGSGKRYSPGDTPPNLSGNDHEQESGGEFPCHMDGKSRNDELTTFVKISSELIPNIGLDSVILIPRKVFLSLKKMESHEKLLKEVVTAKQISSALESEEHKILFVSHRWGGCNFPDDEFNYQFQVIIKYLALHPTIEYLWLDFSSISQVKGSELFWKHLENIPTSLFVATDMLVIPRIDPQTKRTDLADYLNRCWCSLESFVALVNKTNVELYFRNGDYDFFVPIDVERGENYHSAVSQAIKKVEDAGGKDLHFPQWSVKNRDPSFMVSKVRSDIQNIIDSNDDRMLRIVRQSLRMRLRFNMSAGSRYPLLDEVKKLQIWNRLGDVAVESDKAIVLNLMMYVVLYDDGYVASQKTQKQMETLVGDLKGKKSLVLQNKFLSPDHFIQILRFLEDRGHSLEELYVRKNFTCGAGISMFLANNHSIKSLSLMFEGVHDESDIFVALANNISLEKLDLTGNPGIGNSGAKKIATYLTENKTLKILELGEISMGNEGASAIAAALKFNSSLKTLNLSKNKFGDTGATDLITAISQKKSLKKMVLSQNINVKDKNSLVQMSQDSVPFCVVEI